MASKGQKIMHFTDEERKEIFDDSKGTYGYRWIGYNKLDKKDKNMLK